MVSSRLLPIHAPAERQAWTAAVRAQVTVRELSDVDDMRAAADLFGDIWQTSPPSQPIRLELMRGLQYAGNYLAGAYFGDRLTGAAIGFRDSGRGLHSHICGVASGGRARGVGFALKLHQRAWALRHQLAPISWTFDPLNRHNAYFNLTKLAARAIDYLPDFYGPMADALNTGDPSDRLLVEWRLDADNVIAAGDGFASPPLTPAGDTAIILDEAADGAPVPQPRTAGAARLACRTPTDVIALRTSRTDLVVAWRHAQRTALGDALAAGYVISGMTRNGYYILERTAGS